MSWDLNVRGPGCPGPECPKPECPGPECIVLLDIDIFEYSFVYLSHRDLNLGRVSYGMFCELAVSSVSFAAFVAPERLFPSVRPHVTLQVIRSSAKEVTLVTLEWLFSCVLTHHVNFQLIRCNAGKLTHCASVRLFARMGPFVLLQTA